MEFVDALPLRLFKGNSFIEKRKKKILSGVKLIANCVFFFFLIADE